MIKTVGSEEFLEGIAHPFRRHVARQNDPTIQLTIVHPNQTTGWGEIDWDYYPLGSLKSGIDVQSGVFGRNADNRTRVNPQGPIETTST